MFDPAPVAIATATHPSVNGPRLLALADEIERATHDELGFDMRHFATDIKYAKKYSGKLNPIASMPKSDCGTVCCIGGTAAVMFPEVSNRDFDGIGKFFGLDPDKSTQLFYLAIDGRSRYADLGHLVSRAQAAAVLRHLAYTGEVDWLRFLNVA